MDIINQIRDSIFALEKMNLRREDLIIAMSPIVERLLIRELHELQFHNPSSVKSFNQFEGIEVYRNHPYNEILIYDKEKACMFPELIKKISFSEQTLKTIYTVQR